ncbi:STY4851/ECs_5259 family protein [Shewanella sp. AC91-MNA-CIBAN-0169]|uniref:STY4851/ECs_5259 family protein n=1 Tax=Shewanella sp. AC91-MNA-CIBAN-0169 TaxID=3140466 RepID=UPI00332C66DA
MKTVKQCIVDILASRDLVSVSGDPLYSYKLSDIEFQGLYQSLSTSLDAHNISAFIPNGLSSSWSGAFVLYAAEWWRNKFNGGHWSWEPIFSSLNVPENDINPSQRNQLIAEGFRFWRRPLLRNGQGRMFLGSVAIEGGLPLKLITDPNSKLSHYFEQVIKDFGTFSLSSPNSVAIAEAHDHYIAASFRTEAVYSIVGQIAEAIYQLTEQYSLDEQQDPLSYLDSIAPNWLEVLPLNIDTTIAKGLLDSALGQAIAVQRRLPTSIRLVRKLVKKFDQHAYVTNEPNSLKHQWSYQLSISLRSKLNAQFIAQLFSMQVLPERFSLFALGKKPLLLAKAFKPKNNPELYLLDVLTTDLPEDWFDCEIQLMLRNDTESSWYAPLLGGSALDSDEPWVFTENGGDWILAGAGNFSSEATTAVIALPNIKTSNDFFDKDTSYYIENAEPFGEVDHDTSRTLLKISQLGSFIFNDYEVFLGKEDKGQYEFVWQGEELPFLTVPSKCYLGKPKLSAISAQGLQVIPNEKLRWHDVSRDQWLSIDTLPLGQSVVAYFDNGKSKKRFKLASLPQDFKIEFVSGDKLNYGKVIISSSRPPMVAVDLSDNESLHYQVNQDSNSITVELFSSQAQPPALFSLCLWWQEKAKAISITLPFPSHGVCLLDNRQQLVKKNSNLLIDKLNNYELYGYGIEGKIRIIFTLNASDIRGAFSRSAYFSKELSSIEALSSGLSLSTFRADIQALFALSDNLDATLNVTIINFGRELFSFKLSAYIYALVPEREIGCIKFIGEECLSPVDLLMIPLDQPAQMPLQLLPESSISSSERRWIFPDSEVEAGAWLVFCETRHLGIRPLMWSKDLQLLPDARNGFELAASIGQRYKRIQAFTDVAKELSTDYARPEWENVRTLLKFEHVPFTTFDLWRGATKSSEFMLALLLKSNNNEVERVWSLASEFPILWYTLKLDLSIKVLMAFYQHLIGRLGDDMEEVAQDRVQKKLSELVSFFPGFEPFYNLLLFKIGSVDQKPSMTLADYRSDLDNSRNTLSQRNVDSEWPTIFADEILKTVISNVNPQLINQCLVDEGGYKSNVMNAPVLLALASCGQAALLITPEMIHAMREYRRFDIEYFDDSFALTQKMIIGLTKV